MKRQKVLACIAGIIALMACIWTQAVAQPFHWGWGNNAQGQIGDGTTLDHTTPVRIPHSIASISGGFLFSMALKEDGTVWAWGQNVAGQLGDLTITDRNIPRQVKHPNGTLLSDVVAIAAGYHRGLALRADGTVWEWGAISYNSNNTIAFWRSYPEQVPGLTDVVAIASGLYHSLALKSDGTVWAWGSNPSGQLGRGVVNWDYSWPAKVAGLTGVTKIAAGWNHSLAVRSNGTVWAWGNNLYGQLGDGTQTNRRTAFQVAGMSGATDVSGGAWHSLAARSNGTAWSWGNNTYGQLGRGSYLNSYVPIQVTGLSGVTQVSAGAWHSLAARTDGTAWSWGSNDYGQLGDGTRERRLSPVQISGLLNMTMVAAAGEHSLALRRDGTIWGWGSNGIGQLGNGTTNTTYPYSNPLPGAAVGVNLILPLIQVDGAAAHTLALLADGRVRAWGDNTQGQLGDGTTSSRTTPRFVKGQGGVGVLSNIVAVKAGGYYSLALTQSGTVWAWGNNQYGQLGDGTQTNRLTPVLVKGPGGVGVLANVVALAAGGTHVLALKSDGTVWAWGSNGLGQLGNGTTSDSFFPIQVPGLAHVRSIAAGQSHSLALLPDGSIYARNGRVYAWGDNYFGELGDTTTINRLVPTPVASIAQESAYLNNVASIDAGLHHSLARKLDGTVCAWGFNLYGQLGDNTTTSRSRPVLVQTWVASHTLGNLTSVESIAAGGHHSLARMSNGTVRAWGLNLDGQLGDNTRTDRSLPVPVQGLTGVTSIAAGQTHSLAGSTQ